MTGSQAGHNESQKWISPRGSCILCFVTLIRNWFLSHKAHQKHGFRLGLLHFYTLRFTRCAVTAALDLSALNSGALKADHWLRDEKHVISLELAEAIFPGR